MVERALDAGVQRGRLWGRECEFDERKLYLAQSFSSMFAYCVEELGFSEDATYNRIGVARAGRRLPALIEAVRSGKIHLAGVRLLVPHLTGQNHLDLLAQAAGKSKRQIDAMIAKLFPKPAVPATIRKIPSRPSLALSIPPRVALCVPPESELSLLPELELLRPSALTAPPPPRQAQHLAAILEAALDLLIQKVKKERFAVGRKTRTTPPTGPVASEVEGHRPTRHIPDSIKRAVYERDGGRCAFADEKGRRCGETGTLEFDHLDGFARAQVHSVERIRLLCRPHNQYAAEQLYGRTFMQRARLSGPATARVAAGTSDSTRPGTSPQIQSRLI